MVTHGIFLGISDPGISLSCPTEIKNIPTWCWFLVKHEIYGLIVLHCNHGSKEFCPWSWWAPWQARLLRLVTQQEYANTTSKIKVNPTWDYILGSLVLKHFVHTSVVSDSRECILPQPLYEDKSNLHLASPDPLPWGSLWLWWYPYFNATDLLCCFTVINCRFVITLMWGPVSLL